MPTHDHDTPLFEEFPPNTKAEWLTQLERDLKGKPLSDLHTALAQGITMPPFLHPDDMDGPETATLPDSRPDNTWDIGTAVDATDPKVANRLALDDLQGGATALHLRWAQPPSHWDDTLGTLLADIRPDYIALHLEVPPGAGAEAARALARWLSHQGLPPAECRGSITLNPEEVALQPALLTELSTALPAFRWCPADARPAFGPDRVVDELIAATQTALHWLDVLTEAGHTPDTVNKWLWFSVATGTHFLTELAKVRALRLLWANVLAAAHTPAHDLPPVTAHIAFPPGHPDANTHLIRAATQAMSAALGGAQCVVVPPADGQGGSPLYRRMARNVQHVLMLEGHLHRVKDPAAGSYYIEHLTRVLVEAAWGRLKTL